MERAAHDRGGWPTDAAIDRTEHELADWELLMDALVGTLGGRGVMNVDELRRGIESMAPDDYDPRSYYERWLYSTETILTEKGCWPWRARRRGSGRELSIGQRVRVAARPHGVIIERPAT